MYPLFAARNAAGLDNRTPFQKGAVKKLTLEWERMADRRIQISSEKQLVLNSPVLRMASAPECVVRGVTETNDEEIGQHGTLVSNETAVSKEMILWRRGRPGVASGASSGLAYPTEIVIKVEHMKSLPPNQSSYYGDSLNMFQVQTNQWGHNGYINTEMHEISQQRQVTPPVAQEMRHDSFDPAGSSADEDAKTDITGHDSNTLEIQKSSMNETDNNCALSPENETADKTPVFLPPPRQRGFKQWTRMTKEIAAEIKSWKDIPQKPQCLYPKAMTAHRMDVFQIYDAVEPGTVERPKQIIRVLPQSKRRKYHRKIKNFFSGAFVEAYRVENINFPAHLRKDWWTTFPPYVLASYITYFDCNVYHEAMREPLDPFARVIEKRAFPCDDIGLFPITDPDNLLERLRQSNVYSQRWIEQIQVLLDDPTVPRRRRILKLQTMIIVVEWLHQYKNYQSVVAFMTGIQLSHLIRDKNVLCKDDWAQYNQMLKLVDPAGNYAQLRWLMRPIAAKGFDEAPPLVPFVIPWIREVKRAKEAEEAGFGEGHVLFVLRRIRASIKRPLPWHTDVDSSWMQWFKRAHNMWAFYNDFGKTRMIPIKDKCFGVRLAALKDDPELAKELNEPHPLGFNPSEFAGRDDTPYDHGDWYPD